MRQLTVIIPTYNEEMHIGPLLKSVQWADELIVVDSFSTDRTVEIAQTMGAKILQREYIHSANQKNWTIPQATHEWILLIDADERPSPELIQEIKDFLASGQEEYAAFWIGRKNHFMGQHVRYSGWQNDAVIRLFKRDVCRYEDKHVHAEIITQGKVGQLQGKLVHYTHRSIEHFLTKMQRYAHWSAKDYYSKTPKVTLYHLALKPFFRFIKHYILQGGILDGRVGFIVSSIMAWGVFLRYTKIKEMRLLDKAKQSSSKSDNNQSSP